MPDFNDNILLEPCEVVKNSLVKGVMKIANIAVSNRGDDSGLLDIYIESGTDTELKYYFVKGVQLDVGEAFMGSDILVQPGFRFMVHCHSSEHSVSANW